jgi:hypothetical protein
MATIDTPREPDRRGNKTYRIGQNFNDRVLSHSAIYAGKLEPRTRLVQYAPMLLRLANFALPAN